MSKTFRGLTWDHPRGKDALVAASHKSGGLIDWQVQSLEGFESAPIGELCEEYDLVVLDHPHLGEALALDCLQPIDVLFNKGELVRIAKQSVGPSFESYNMAGHQWALPLDAATQVMAVRADLADGQSLTEYDDLIEYTRDGGSLGLCVSGPHAFLSYLSIACAFDPDISFEDQRTFLSSDISFRAIDTLMQLWAHSIQSTEKLNPIALLELMTSTDEVAVCPLIYGYVNYAQLGIEKRITFEDAPTFSGGMPGSIIGGTGIAISKKCDVTDELIMHLCWLMSEDVQRSFIPENCGQPSNACAWGDGEINRVSNRFYANTLDTITHSTVRPRHNGYIRFQSEASAILRNGLLDAEAVNNISEKLAAAYSQSIGGYENDR